MKLSWLCFFGFWLLVAGCYEANDKVEHDHAYDSTSSDMELDLDVSALMLREPKIVANAPYKSNNELAFNLYEKFKGTENITFSPFSISLAMAMVYAGSRGKTEEAMKNVLHFKENTDEFHKSYGEFANLMSYKNRSETDTIFKISNMQWMQDGFSFLKDYTQILANDYAAKPVLLDFDNHPSLSTQTINKAVSQQTEGEIPRLLKKELQRETRLVLTNAIYFESHWKDEFNPDATTDGAFTPMDESATKASYMKKTDYFPYYEDKEKQALLLPYRDPDFATLFILPKEGAYASFEEKHNADNLRKTIDSLNEERVEIWLPKFSHRTSPQLKPALKELGLSLLFDKNKADLSGINGVLQGPKKLYVGDVIHEAVVKMYEAGTTAAAATAVLIIEATAAVVEEPEAKIFHATRPFMFYILHKPSNTILFMGRVDTPQT